jgi:Flp pilus assembly protein TadG
MTSLRSRPARLDAASERGFVTAETAMVLPTLMGLGLALVLVVTAAATQLRCTDAAWEAARGLARGEPADFATRVVDRLGPAGASVSVETVDGSVLVRVSARLALAGALLPAIHVEGQARVTCEPGVPCATAAAGQGER